jgi:hypothetical protein
MPEEVQVLILAALLVDDMEERRLHEEMRLQEERDRTRRLARRRARRWWVRPWLAMRVDYGWYDTLITQLEEQDPQEYKKMMRVEPEMFNELVERLDGRLRRPDTNCRKAISPGMKVAITLRYVACGCDYSPLMYGFYVSSNAMCAIVRDVCQALIDEFHAEVLHTPRTEEEWLEVEHGFSTRWQFHHALGAIDGKHVRIKKPANSGSLYYNYKGYFSIILMALVDSNYKFMWVEVGANGASSDCQIFNDSQLKQRLDEDRLHLPAAYNLRGDNRPCCFFFIGDDAFPLRLWMIKPYSRRDLTHAERIFNYRCSRARRVVENAFGILANRFRCMLGTMEQQPQTIQKIVLACVCLHNLMRDRYPTEQARVLDTYDERHNRVPGQWREDHQLDDLERQGHGNRTTRDGNHLRDTLRAYYSSPIGAVPWQEKMLMPYQPAPAVDESSSSSDDGE